MKRLFIHIFAICFIGMFGVSLHASDSTQTIAELGNKLQEAAVRLEAVAIGQDSAIPPEILRKAEGILVLHHIKAGFIFGGKGGSGVLMVRDTLSHRWSPPAFIDLGEGSAGLQIGVQVTDSVIVFMTRESMGIIDGSRFQVGVDAAAVAGPHFVSEEDDFSSTPILIYDKNSGLYAGATIKGGFIYPDNKANELFYGKPGITVRDIVLNKKVVFPQEGRALLNTIRHYSK